MADGDFTMSEIAPVLYSAAQTVAAEPVGCLQSVDTSFDNKQVAVGDAVKVPYAGAATSSAFAHAAYAPLGTAHTANAVSISITASEISSWSINAEEKQSLINGGNFGEYQRQKAEQAMRTLRNKMSAAAAVALKQGASRAVGTAGTTPFSSDISSINSARYELVRNGAPMVDPQLVVTCSAYQNLGNLGTFNQAHIAGTADDVRTGRLSNRYGFRISEDANIAVHTIGSGTGYKCDATIAIGETAYTVDTGSGTIVAGDVVTLEASGDDNKYVVGTALSSGTLHLNRPGLLVAKADEDALTVGAAYTPSFAFERSAVVGVVRTPMFEFGGGVTGQTISDGKGFTYLYIEAVQWGIKTYYIAAAWGFKAVNPQNIITILG